jgi:hypothetical protein
MPNSTPDDIPNPGTPSKTRRNWKAWALALGFGISPFLLAELGLRVAGWDDSRPDLIRAYGSAGKLFERQDSIFRTAAVREPFFQHQEFAAVKPRAGLRIFCFGGSTVHGHPYQQDTAFPRWLELELKARCPGRAIEVLNCGGVSYASYRIAPLIREVLDYQPDLIVLATGENEFLEDRTFRTAKEYSAARLWLGQKLNSLRIVKLARQTITSSEKHRPIQNPEVDPRLDSKSGYASYHRDAKWLREVCSNFEASLREMAQACRQRQVPLLLCRLGCDLRDCAPFKSEHREGLSPDDEIRWRKAFDDGSEKQAREPDLAWESYARAEKLDPTYALLSWRMARLMDLKHSPDIALRYYLQARDQDICPLRLVSDNEAVLTRVAHDFGLQLLDVSALLASDCPDAIPGRDRYLDHVHPMIEGHQRIGRALANSVRSMGLVNLTGWSENRRREVYQKQIETLPVSYFADARRRVDWLEGWARREKLADEMIPINADGWLRIGMRDFELARFSEASLDWKKAVSLNPALKENLVRFKTSLEAQGRPASAAKLSECMANFSGSTYGETNLVTEP